MKIQVQVEMEIPNVGADNEQIQEWLEFQLGCRAGISMENPLHDQDIDADSLNYR